MLRTTNAELKELKKREIIGLIKHEARKYNLSGTIVTRKFVSFEGGKEKPGVRVRIIPDYIKCIDHWTGSRKKIIRKSDIARDTFRDENNVALKIYGNPAQIVSALESLRGMKI